MKPSARAAMLGGLLFFVGCAGKHAAAPPATQAGNTAPAEKKPQAENTDEDPFRWMETASLDAWLHREGDAARHVLDALPERSRFAQMIGALNADRPDVLMMSSTAKGDFIVVREPHHNTQFVRFRDRAGKTTQVLESSPDTVIFQIFPSPDARYLAYVESKNGGEVGVLRIVDLASHRVLEESADRVRYPRLRWWPGKAAFTFLRFHPLLPTTPHQDQYRHPMSKLHQLGTSFDADVTLLDDSRPEESWLTADEFPAVEITSSGRWLIANVEQGVAPEVAVYVKDARSVNDPHVRWQRVVSHDDHVVNAVLAGDALFMNSEKDAPNGHIVRAAITASGGLGPSEVVMPESPTAAIQDIRAGRGGIYVSAMNDGVNRLSLIRYRPGQSARPQVVAIGLPEDASVSELGVVAGDDSPVAIETNGWFRRSQWSRYEGPQGEAVRIEGAAQEEFHAPVRHVNVRSLDGTEVPVTILGPMQETGKPVPTVLTAYGNYGIPIDPHFWADQVAWIQHGGVYAIAHVRGGGEKGRKWHLAGQKANKHKSIEDCIAAAEHLIVSGIAGRDTLIAMGGSAGGITVGSAIVQRPDLFTAAIFSAAVFNPLREEQMPSGPANVPEFGTASTPEGYRVLKAMDPYAHLKVGVTYPSVLLLVGANDPRVEPWQSAKFAERLRQVSNGKAEVVVRVAFDEGHGIGSTAEAVDARYADAWAFAWARATRKTDVRP